MVSGTSHSVSVITAAKIAEMEMNATQSTGATKLPREERLPTGSLHRFGACVM